MAELKQGCEEEWCKIFAEYCVGLVIRYCQCLFDVVPAKELTYFFHQHFIEYTHLTFKDMNECNCVLS